jgi:hypothetical protein
MCTAHLVQVAKVLDLEVKVFLGLEPEDPQYVSEDGLHVYR